MAYTDPGATWPVDRVLSGGAGGNLSVYLAANFQFVSTHTHSGAAGDGSSSVGPLVRVDFTDAAAPAAPGAGKTRLYAVSGVLHYRAGAAGADRTLADLESAQTFSGAKTFSAFVDITAGGLRVKGLAPEGPVDTTNTWAGISIAAGYDGVNETDVRLDFYRSSTQLGIIGFFRAAVLGTIAGVVGQKEDFTIFLNGAKAFFDASDSGRLVARGGARLGASLQMVAAIYPATDGAAAQTAAAIYAGSGVPSNANGANGDFYLRSDGASGSNNTVYHKEAGAWVGLLT